MSSLVQHYNNWITNNLFEFAQKKFVLAEIPFCFSYLFDFDSFVNRVFNASRSISIWSFMRNWQCTYMRTIRSSAFRTFGKPCSLRFCRIVLLFRFFDMQWQFTNVHIEALCVLCPSSFWIRIQLTICAHRQKSSLIFFLVYLYAINLNS